MMKDVAAAVSLALLASSAQAQSLKEKYELSEERFEKAPGDECIFGKSHGINRAIRLRHQQRKRAPKTPTPRPRPASACGNQATCLSLVLATGAEARTATERYELSERCREQAAEVFAKEWEAPDYNSVAKVMANYENHYNFRLNKCFYLLTSTGKSGTKIMALFDLNENNENNENKGYGLYVSTEEAKEPIQCYVQTSECKTEEEWRALIRPFMED
jgi:hypothetical protein